MSPSWNCCEAKCQPAAPGLLGAGPELGQHAAADALAGVSAQVLGGQLVVAREFHEPPKAHVGAKPEHLVAEHVVAAAEEVGPVARLGDLLSSPSSFASRAASQVMARHSAAQWRERKAMSWVWRT